MISRRLLRTKVLQTVYAYYQSVDVSINDAEKELLHSIRKSYDLYHYLMLLVLDVVKYSENRIETAKNRLVPSYDDLNPNTKFIDNKVIAQLNENRQLNTYLQNTRMSWANHPELIKRLYTDITESEEFIEYMKKPSRSYEDDKKMLVYIYEEIIINCELLYQVLEEQSIFWIDTIDFVISMVAKTIKQFKIGHDSTAALMQLYKNDDDREFVKRLFRKVVLNHQEYKKLIESHVKNWDVERIAFIDTLIMELAIAEIIEFNSIPVKVTFNEYLEISKFYSTERSSTFINGILDKIIHTLKNEKKFQKTGRGLVGEEDTKRNNKIEKEYL